MTLWTFREYLLELEDGKKQWVGGKRLDGEDLCRPLEMMVGVGSRWPVAKLGMRLGYYILRSWGRGEGLVLAYMFPLSLCSLSDS